MNKTISTPGAPAAIGPYSQAVEAGGFIFTSGQLPLDPESGGMPEGIAECTRRSLENIKAILEAAGNEVYAEYFSGGTLPARSAVQVAKLPRGGRVEIEAVAVK